MSGGAELDRTALSVYRLILLETESDPSAIGRRLGLSAEDTRALIDQLVDQGLLIASSRSAIGFRAVNPGLGAKILSERERHEAARRQQQLEQHHADLAALSLEYAAHNRQETMEGTETICGDDAVRLRIETVVDTATVELASFQPEELSESNLVAGRVQNRRLLDRGVHLRSIYLGSAANQRLLREHIKIMTSRGLEARVAATLPMRLMLVDRQSAILPLPRREGQQRILVVHFPPLVEALQALYESYWEHSRPVEGYQPTLPGGLTDQEQAVLRQLAGGATDDTVARALGIGVRTERRIVAELMDRLNATSRFEAGVKAARMGLI